MIIVDLVQLNKYIRRKYPEFKTDILFYSGTMYMLIGFHSCSGDINFREQIESDKIKNESDIKSWIKKVMA